MRVWVFVGIDDGNRDRMEEMMNLSNKERRALGLELKEELIPPEPAEDAAAVE